MINSLTNDQKAKIIALAYPEKANQDVNQVAIFIRDGDNILTLAGRAISRSEVGAYVGNLSKLKRQIVHPFYVTRDELKKVLEPAAPEQPFLPLRAAS